MIISRAPLRVSFFGGGTDFPEYFREHGGAVLATAINKYSYVTASRFESHLFDYAVRVSYSKGEMVKNIAEIQHPVFRACLQYCGLEKGIELHTVADLPAFTGLGSSSSFTVSLLQALHAYKGEFVKPLQLAYEAIHVERNMLGECVGVQDQTTAAVGGFNVLEFKAEDDIRMHALSLSPRRIEELEAHLFLVFTGVKRRAQHLEVKKLQNLTVNHEHLRGMRRMVDVGHELLVENKPLAEFGLLLHEAWMAKRRLDGCVSTSEIDEMYEQGRAAGAWGGKLLGAGGGGFILFVAPPECQANLEQTFADKYRMKVGVNAPASQIIFAS
jgi:D-glycero-alpha-D-manno-heptose-7-phosphate kinase